MIHPSSLWQQPLCLSAATPHGSTSQRKTNLRHQRRPPTVSPPPRGFAGTSAGLAAAAASAGPGWDTSPAGRGRGRSPVGGGRVHSRPARAGGERASFPAGVGRLAAPERGPDILNPVPTTSHHLLPTLIRTIHPATPHPPRRHALSGTAAAAAPPGQTSGAPPWPPPQECTPGGAAAAAPRPGGTALCCRHPPD